MSLAHQNGAPGNLPRLVRVKSANSSRYPDLKRPESWDARVAGIDTIQTTDGSTIELISDGGQSVPEVGWSLMLTELEGSAYRWTLYGLPLRARSRT